MSTHLLFDLPVSDPHPLLSSLLMGKNPTIIFPHLSSLFPNQDCHHSLRMPTCVGSTLKRRWFSMMPDTEPCSHWPSKGLRPEPSPLWCSLAPSLPSLPWGLSSCCCGVTRPMCHSLLAEWLTHERERGGGWGLPFQDLILHNINSVSALLQVVTIVSSSPHKNIYTGLDVDFFQRWLWINTYHNTYAACLVFLKT